MRTLALAPLLLLAATACTKKAPTATEVPAIVEEAAVVVEPAAVEGDGAYVPTHPVERWVVGEALVDCVGVAPQRCLHVRRGDNANWENIYGDVEGFDFQEGTRYEISVELIPVENPPADGSSIRYKLVEQHVPVIGGPDEKTCTTSADCGENEWCSGPAGCVVPWTCQPARPCTMDLRPYCSCEGKTVFGSGSCPPEPYKHAGECAE